MSRKVWVVHSQPTLGIANEMTKLSTKEPFERAAVKREREEAAVAAAVVPAQETPAPVPKLEVPKYQPSATKFQKACGYLEREEKLKNNDFQWSTAKCGQWHMS